MYRCKCVYIMYTCMSSNLMQCNVMLCNAMQCNAVQYMSAWMDAWMHGCSFPKPECQAAAAANGVQSPGTSRSHRSRTPCVAQTLLSGNFPSGKRLHNYGKSPFIVEKLRG